MANIAVKNLKGVEVSDFEIRLPKPTYTYKTLAALSSAYPDEEFALIIGADNWLIFNKWANYRYILDNFSIIVYPRRGFEIKNEDLPDNVILVSAPIFPYSSTEVRKAINSGNPACKKMLHGEVLEEIRREGLYMKREI